MYVLTMNAYTLSEHKLIFRTPNFMTNLVFRKKEFSMFMEKEICLVWLLLFVIYYQKRAFLILRVR